jgi:hypothetical protein
MNVMKMNARRISSCYRAPDRNAPAELGRAGDGRSKKADLVKKRGSDAIGLEPHPD